MTEAQISAIKAVMDRLDSAPVECDGFARLASTLLQRVNAEHQVMFGKLSGPPGNIHHFWLEVDGYMVDYRARMWLGKTAPHGFFRSPHAGWSYQGAEYPVEPFSDAIFWALAGIPVESFDLGGIQP